MKRILIIVGLVIVIFFGITIVTKGFENEKLNLNISSYEAIQGKSDSLTMAINAYNTKNDTEYNALLANLNGSVKKYKTSKTKYEEVIEELNGQGQLEQVIEDQIIYSNKKLYNIDYIQTQLGNYSDKEGLVLTLGLSSSEQVDPLATTQDFTVCDLKFLITGEYINIARFISDIEGNDELAFEIRDFNMTKQSADFKVYGLRITNSSLLQMNTNQTENNSTPNTVGGNGTNTNTTTNSGTTTTNPNGTTTPTPRNSIWK